MTYVWVEILLLSNLAKRPAHGYELRQRVEAGSGYTLSNNSLYPVLRRFHDAAAVTRTPQQQANRPVRHVYEITDVGRELLHDMLADLPDDLAGESAEFLARLASFDRLDIAERLGVLDARLAALDRLRTRLHGLAEEAPPDGWSRLVLDEVLRRTHDEQHWLAAVRVRAESTQEEKTDDDR